MQLSALLTIVCMFLLPTKRVNAVTKVGAPVNSMGALLYRCVAASCSYQPPLFSFSLQRRFRRGSRRQPRSPRRDSLPANPHRSRSQTPQGNPQDSPLANRPLNPPDIPLGNLRGSLQGNPRGSLQDNLLCSRLGSRRRNRRGSQHGNPQVAPVGNL